MSVIIRKLLEPDFPEVEKLFNGKKHLIELKWLFANPDMDSEYNAYVAEKDGYIIGVLGYSVTDFNIQGKIAKGIIPMSWMVSADHRGLAGIQLLKKVLNLGEFGFAVTFSETAKKIIPIARFEYRTSVTVYQKILWPYPIHSGTLKFIGSYFGTILGSLFSLFSYPNKDINIKATDMCDPSLGAHAQSNFSGFSNIITVNKIKWLLSCPLVNNTYCFQILRKNIAIGYMVFYISTNKKGIKKGRIIHMSCLGDHDRIWRQAICALELFLKKEKCSVLTVMAKNQIFLRSILKLGFYKTSKSYMVYFDDRLKDISESAMNDWNLTFAISDKGYRGI